MVAGDNRKVRRGEDAKGAQREEEVFAKDTVCGMRPGWFESVDESARDWHKYSEDFMKRSIIIIGSIGT